MPTEYEQKLYLLAKWKEAVKALEQLQDACARKGLVEVFNTLMEAEGKLKFAKYVMTESEVMLKE